MVEDRSEKRNGGRLRAVRDIAVAVAELEFPHDIAAKPSFIFSATVSAAAALSLKVRSASMT